MTIKSKKNTKVFSMRSKKVKRVNIKKGGTHPHPKHFYDKSYDDIIKRYNEVQVEIIRINGLINQSKTENLDELVIMKTILDKNLLMIKMENNAASLYIDYCQEYFEQKNIKDLDTERIKNSQKSIDDVIVNKEIIFKLISKPISKKGQVESYDKSKHGVDVLKQRVILPLTLIQIKLINNDTKQEKLLEVRGDTTIAKLKNLLADDLNVPAYKIGLTYESNILLNYFDITSIQYNDSKYITYYIDHFYKPSELSSENPSTTYEYVSALELIERFDKMEIHDKQEFIKFLEKMSLKTLFTKIKKGIHTQDEYKEFLKIMYINNFVENINIDSSLSTKDITIPIFNNVKPTAPPTIKIHLVKELYDMNNQLFQLNKNFYNLNKNPIKNKDEIQQITFLIQALQRDINKFVLTNEDIYNYVMNLKKYQMINKNESAQNREKSPKFSQMTIGNFFTSYYYTTENEKIWRYITADEIRESLSSLSHKDLAIFLQQISIMDFNAYQIINKITSKTESLEDMLSLYNILIQQISFKIIELSHGGDEMDFIPLSIIT